jgi:ATPase subunit of ABC transporter with duplicated ATPase domains
VIVTSHGRYFLDRVVDRTVELKAGRLREFAGGTATMLRPSALHPEPVGRAKPRCDRPG